MALSTATEDVIAQITAQIETQLAALRRETFRLESVLTILQDGGAPAVVAGARLADAFTAPLPKAPRGKAAKTTRADGATKAAKNERPLKPMAIEVLQAAGGPLTTEQIAAGVKAAGYVSNSANFRQVVYMAINRDRRFRKNADGAWTLRAKKGGAE